MAAGSPGVPARNSEGGSGRRRCETAWDRSKRTAVALQPLVDKVNQGKSGLGESSGSWSKVAMCQENNRQSEAAVRQQGDRWS